MLSAIMVICVMILYVCYVGSISVSYVASLSYGAAFLMVSLMDTQQQQHNRQRNILCWNVRGMNAQSKLTTIKSKIKETNCDIICLQETKKENFDVNFIRTFCPSSFDYFEFITSFGALGGSIIIWKSIRFSGTVIAQNEYAMSVEFSSILSGAVWVLTNVYAPYTTEGRTNFLNWLHDFSLPDDTDCLLVGYFNLIRKPSDRNRPGGNVQDMLKFNEALSNLNAEELPLRGNHFTWSNKQASPLLERLDWFFASVS
jgi:hypothetical protein